MKITNKTQMYEMLQRGRFGNIARVWGSVAEVLASDYQGCVSIRSHQTNNPVRKYHIPLDQLEQVVRDLPNDQRNSPLMFNESPPDEARYLQGEVARVLPGAAMLGLRLRYTHSPLPMKLAFDADWEARYVTKTMPVGDGGNLFGLQALMLLKQNLLPVDLDDLLELLDEFDEHIVEFSAFNRPVGTIPGRRTLIWEVRNY